MKKKIIFAVATGFFAVATMFNMNVLQANSTGDVSLDAIAVMAQAQNEGGGVSVTVTCYDRLGQGIIKSYSKRKCDISTSCARTECSSWDDPGTCTFTN